MYAFLFTLHVNICRNSSQRRKSVTGNGQFEPGIFCSDTAPQHHFRLTWHRSITIVNHWMHRFRHLCLLGFPYQPKVDETSKGCNHKLSAAAEARKIPLSVQQRLRHTYFLETCSIALGVTWEGKLFDLVKVLLLSLTVDSA